MKKGLERVAVHLSMHVKRLQAECDSLNLRPSNELIVDEYESLIEQVNKDKNTILFLSNFVGPVNDIFNVIRDYEKSEHIIVNISSNGINAECLEDFVAVATHQFCTGNAQPLENPLGEATRVVDGKGVN